MKKLKVYWPFLPLILFVIAAVAGWFLLPAELKLADGAGNTVPKLVGLLAPVAISALAGSQMCFPGKRRAAGIILLVLAAVMTLLVFTRNL